MKLREHQKRALMNMMNGCILNGDTGSGKSLTALAYYHLCQGGDITDEKISPMTNPCPLYIITTARKRDTLDWVSEMIPFHMNPKPELSMYDDHTVVIDSWNNIEKYKDVKDAFFIFDEQRVSGKGKWVKVFLKITKHNDWILLSATPGDDWEDYIPVFIANGFYKNFTDFRQQHIVYKPFMDYPVIDRYINTRKLERLRSRLLIDMTFRRTTVAHNEYLPVDYNKTTYKEICKDRWDIYKDEPLDNASSYCYCIRRLINSDPSRLVKCMEIFEDHPKCIIFYNFDYELDLLKGLFENIAAVGEWNGHVHEPIPLDSDKWVYLVQYIAGCEGWNCIHTDTIIFFSQTYSYKQLKQAMGRIDRLNTPFVDLYYYHLISKAGLDIAIRRALTNKKKFNEGKYFSSIDAK